MAAELRGSTILRTVALDGRPVRNHAKFVAIDHRYLIVTSANSSRRAEEYNIDLGLVLDNPLLTGAIERQTAELERYLYEVVRRSR